jgi:hypothetical protein
MYFEHDTVLYLMHFTARIRLVILCGYQRQTNDEKLIARTDLDPIRGVFLPSRLPLTINHWSSHGLKNVQPFDRILVTDVAYISPVPQYRYAKDLSLVLNLPLTLP